MEKPYISKMYYFRLDDMAMTKDGKMTSDRSKWYKFTEGQKLSSGWDYESFRGCKGAFIPCDY